MYFAGVEGRNIFQSVLSQWTIVEINKNTNQRKTTGTIITDKYSIEDLTIKGLIVIKCTVSGKNAPVSEHFKITNVSKEEIFI